MSLVSYKDVLPPGLIYRTRSTLRPLNELLVQQLVNIVRKSDTSESYKERALTMLEKHKLHLSDTEYRLLLDIVNWIAQTIDYVKIIRS